MSVATAVRYGCEVPRIWTPELRPLTSRTTRGFEAIEFAEQVIGLTLFPWQRWLLIHALELTEDRQRFRFDTVVVLVARQNGKTLVLNVLSLWRMFVDYAGLVIGTAQNLDVAEEAWGAAVDMAEGVPELKAEIEGIDRVNGKKALRLRASRRYKVQAANRRGGRGLSADLVALDELREHQNWDAWAAVTKTTNARDAAQVWCLSNAGDKSSVVLSHLRERANKQIESGTPGSIGLFEWSAPDDCDVFDPDGWAQANPSLGWKIRESKLRADAETDPEPLFRTEVLCQWVDSVAPDDALASWPDRANPTAAPSAPLHLGIDVAPNMASAAIAVCGSGPTGEVVEVIDHGSGTAWVPARLEELRANHGPVSVGIIKGSPAEALAPDLGDVVLLTAADTTAACATFARAVTDGTVAHRDDPRLNAAVAGARRKFAGDGWRWTRVGSDTDISPLYAACVARHLWATGPAPLTTEQLLNSFG